MTSMLQMLPIIIIHKIMYAYTCMLIILWHHLSFIPYPVYWQYVYSKMLLYFVFILSHIPYTLNYNCMSSTPLSYDPPPHRHTLNEDTRMFKNTLLFHLSPAIPSPTWCYWHYVHVVKISLAFNKCMELTESLRAWLGLNEKTATIHLPCCSMMTFH